MSPRPRSRQRTGSRTTAAPLSLWGEAWKNLRRQPLFLISAFLILRGRRGRALPGLFSPIDPTSEACQLANSDAGPAAGHPLGFTQQGCDVYARVIYGTRSSVTVGLFTTIGVLLIGGIIGALAGFYGGWIDSVLARINDIFFALPLILGAIVLMQLPMFRDEQDACGRSCSSWSSSAGRRSPASPAAPSSRSGTPTSSRPPGRWASRSSAPSCATCCRTRWPRSSSSPPSPWARSSSPKSTLSFLGIGLPPSVMSWGNDIQAAQASLRSNPMPLLYPAIALSITVLSFIMLGDALRDALDPKARKR